MTFLSKTKVTGFAAGLLGAASLGLSVPSTAAPTVSTYSDHQILVRALEDAGVTVVLNSPSYCDRETAGAYHSYGRTLVVCQENARRPYADQGWTEFDFDTLRHEAHHVVQDCLNGTVGDNEFSGLFDEEAEFEEFVRGALAENQIDWIIGSYASEGEEVILHELEAFAAAESVSPETIAEAVENTCTYKF